jgi:hypothetical protein
MTLSEDGEVDRRCLETHAPAVVPERENGKHL